MKLLQLLKRKKSVPCMTMNTIASTSDLWEGLKIFIFYYQLFIINLLSKFIKKSQFSMKIYPLKMTSQVKSDEWLYFDWCF